MELYVNPPSGVEATNSCRTTSEKKREKERKGTNTLYDSDDNRPPTQTRGQFKKRKRIICLIYPLECLGLLPLWVELQRN